MGNYYDMGALYYDTGALYYDTGSGQQAQLVGKVGCSPGVLYANRSDLFITIWKSLLRYGNLYYDTAGGKSFIFWGT